MDEPKPVIFLAFANDRCDADASRYLRNLPEEARRLRQALACAEQAGLCEVVVRQNATAADVLDVFQDPRHRDRVAVFHYGGHADGYRVLLESASGQLSAADAGGLASFLGHQRGLRLVFLNACSTSGQVQGLLMKGVPVVVATSQAIQDEAAVEFSYRLYNALGSGATLRRSFEEATAALTITRGGATRDLTGAISSQSEMLPWHLRFGDGAEVAAEWSLPEAAGDPLYGLPSLPQKDLPANPYLEPLSWFGEENAEMFFGRGYQVRELFERVTDGGRPPILLLYGRSGVGKSSILAAGLKPRLTAAGWETRFVRRDPQEGLLGGLRRALGDEGQSGAIGHLWKAAEKDLGRPLVVILDQVEEALSRSTNDRPWELSDFVVRLSDAFLRPEGRPQGKLVLGFRMEWLAVIERRLAEAMLCCAKMFLEPLDRRGIVDAIRGPGRLVATEGRLARPILSRRLADHYSLEIEEGLPERIALDLLGDRDALVAPTLQILMSTMWTIASKANPGRPRFDSSLYDSLGRDGILLGDFLNRQLAMLRSWSPEGVDSGLVLDLLQFHTTPFGSAKVRSEREVERAYAHAGPRLSELLQKAKDLYLLADAGKVGDEAQVGTRLAHDTLALLVRERFDRSDRPAQRAWRILCNRLPDWQGGRTGSPLDSTDLEIVERAEPWARAWSGDERRLVEASREARERTARSRSRLQAQSLLRAMGHGSGSIDRVELDALWDLAGLSPGAEGVRAEVLSVALEDPGSISQLANCLEPIVHASVGLDPTRRNAILGNIVLPGMRAAESDPKVAWTIARIGVVLNCEDGEYQDLASRALAAYMEAGEELEDAQWTTLAPRLSASLSDQIASRFVAQLTGNPELANQPRLASMVAILGARLSRDTAERTGQQILVAMKGMRRAAELASLARVLIAVDPGNELAEQAARRVEEVISNTAEANDFCLLDETWQMLTSQLGKPHHARTSPPVAPGQSEVIRLARSLQSMGSRLLPPDADRAADRLLSVMLRQKAGTWLETLASALESVAPRMTEQAAQNASDRIVESLFESERPDVITVFCRVFREIARHLDAAQVAGRVERVLERLMGLLMDTDGQGGIDHLILALSHVAPLAPVEILGQHVSSLRASGDAADLLRLSLVIAVFAPRLEKAEVGRIAGRIAERIFSALDGSEESAGLRPLAEAAAAIVPWLPSAASTDARDRLVHALSMVGDLHALRTLTDALLSLPHETDTAFLLELLKYPLCVGEVRFTLLAAIERRTGRTFGGDLWSLVGQATELGFRQDDLSRPPTRRIRASH
jgi:hypothetical protein